MVNYARIPLCVELANACFGQLTVYGLNAYFLMHEILLYLAKIPHVLKVSIYLSLSSCPVHLLILSYNIMSQACQHLYTRLRTLELRMSRTIYVWWGTPLNFPLYSTVLHLVYEICPGNVDAGDVRGNRKSIGNGLTTREEHRNTCSLSTVPLFQHLFLLKVKSE